MSDRPGPLDDAEKRLPVILVLGSAHGGSTITNIIVGQHPDLFSAGTLAGFPDNGQFEQGNTCSCGEPAELCPFWSSVRAAVEAQPSAPARTVLLLEQILRLSGAKAVIDVAHNLDRLVELATEPQVKLYVVYVRRPLRGVTHSIVRKSRQRKEFKRPLLDFAFRVHRTARTWWITRQLALEYCVAFGIPHLKVEYEQICLKPDEFLRKVCAMVSLDTAAIPAEVASERILKTPPHLIRGNRKLRSLEILQLREDRSYLDKHSFLERAVALWGVLRARIGHRFFGKKRFRRLLADHRVQKDSV